MNYSTLKEVYNVDTFEKEKKKKKKIKYEDIDDTLSVSSQSLNNNVIKQEQPSLNDTNIPSQIKPLNLQPYYDEELEKYLISNDSKQLQNMNMNTTNTTNTMNTMNNMNTQYIPNGITQTSLQISNVNDSKNIEIAPKNNTKLDNFYKNIINIGLFIFIGVLIIFLCDQITEIAINIGMKKTMLIMEKYLSEAHIVKDK